jgi:hypothetical protein
LHGNRREDQLLTRVRKKGTDEGHCKVWANVQEVQKKGERVGSTWLSFSQYLSTYGLAKPRN